jgi:hypothetical protein
MSYLIEAGIDADLIKAGIDADQINADWNLAIQGLMLYFVIDKRKGSWMK